MPTNLCTSIVVLYSCYFFTCFPTNFFNGLVQTKAGDAAKAGKKK